MTLRDPQQPGETGRVVGLDARVRIRRGQWCGHTALVVAITDTSVKADFGSFARWYARSEVEPAQ